MNKIVMIFSISHLVFYSCNQNTDNKKHTGPISSEQEKMIVYKEDSTVKGSRTELFLQNFGKLMGLQKINGGADGLYIRIWLWHRKASYVINIIKSQKEDDCQIIQFNTVKKDSTEYIVIHKELKNLVPKLGWKEFFETMTKYRIPVLESGTIQNREKIGVTEASYVNFEIAEPDKYRYYEYLEPSYYKEIDKNSELVYNFLKYLSDEMNIHVY